MKRCKSLDVNSNTKEKFITDSTENLWAYGWTHYGMAGQTRARMNKLTSEVEIKEYNKWIKCRAGCEELFTSPQLFGSNASVSTEYLKGL